MLYFLPFSFLSFTFIKSACLLKQAGNIVTCQWPHQLSFHSWFWTENNPSATDTFTNVNETTNVQLVTHKGIFLFSFFQSVLCDSFSLNNHHYHNPKIIITIIIMTNELYFLSNSYLKLIYFKNSNLDALLFSCIKLFSKYSTPTITSSNPLSDTNQSISLTSMGSNNAIPA